LRADYFGATSFGKIMGLSSMIVMLGMVVGPIVAGVLRDRTGDYQLGFVILAVVAALGSVWFFLSTPPAQPERGPVPVDEPVAAAGPAEDAVEVAQQPPAPETETPAA
jgi:MFS family permease